MLVICPWSTKPPCASALHHMKELPVKLDHLGTRVVLNVTRDIWS